MLTDMGFALGIVVVALAGFWIIKVREALVRHRSLKAPRPRTIENPELEAAILAQEAREAKNRMKTQRKFDSGKRVFVSPAGYVANPMRAYPRNARCFCGSGQKFKVCCLDKVERFVPTARAKAAHRLVALAERGVDVAGMIAKTQPPKPSSSRSTQAIAAPTDPVPPASP